MSKITVNIRMDKTLKRDFETVCSEMGLTMTRAFTIFAEAVSSGKISPFKITPQLKPQEITLASENVLAEDWSLPEEDEAWANL
jgi:DNA-damage-inducible protein J